MHAPKIGLLPLYIKLYDDALPAMREKVEAYYATIAGELEKRGLQVVTAPVCRKAKEFFTAVESFEHAGVEAIVTLHLAYSPSLESSVALAETALPIIVLDTTPDFAFTPATDPELILYNHGIHGVQDMCNLLIRNGKPFQIEAGHWQHSDVLDRVAAWARAARLARVMQTVRVGRLGEAFRGMGDFSVPEEMLSEVLGVETVPADPQAFAKLLPSADAQEVEEEIGLDLARFAVDGLDPDVHRRAVQAGLAVRYWVEQEQLTAFSINFLAVNRASGLPAMPFLEISKAMARGTGYAGEGDVLTAALVGTLASAYPETTFTEMFCPDWAGGSVFLSHMGEMNLSLIDGKPLLLQKPFPWTDVGDAVMAVGRFKPGKAVLVNLAPGPEETFTLLVAPGEMLAIDGEDVMRDTVRGWFRPAMPLADFLEDYSRVGGTHHSALVYGDITADMVRFGEMMDWDVEVFAEGKS